MDNRVKFYRWLITQLSRRPMTFAEIADAWMDATANVYREELPLRTFHRYRKCIESSLASWWNVAARLTAIAIT